MDAVGDDVGLAFETAPLQLFDANIFYPSRYTLAYSDSMLAPALSVAPLRCHSESLSRVMAVSSAQAGFSRLEARYSSSSIGCKLGSWR